MVTQRVTSRLLSTLTTYCLIFAGFQRDVLRMLREIQEKQEAQGKILQGLVNKIEVTPGETARFEIDRLPLKTMESIVEFNASLSESEEQYHQLLGERLIETILI